MVETNPSGAAVGATTLVEYTDACLGEGDMQMLVRCIRFDLDCAQVCDATGKIPSRQTAFEPEMVRPVLEALGAGVPRLRRGV